MRKTLLIVFNLMVMVGCAVDPAERNNTGNALHADGRYEEALSAYQLAQVNAPDTAVPYLNAASSMARTGRTQAAIQALEQALRHTDAPVTRAAIYHNMGNLYFDLALYDDALVAYRQALLLQPEAEDTRYNYEMALSRLPTATPTPQEQQSEPEEDQTDPQATPTPNPAGLDETTPTPSPASEADAGSTPDTGPGEPGEDGQVTPLPDGQLSVEEAERRLDAIQQGQRTLREYLEAVATPGARPGQDW
jgi:tetratricopeptide (TPR) repeat protein